MKCSGDKWSSLQTVLAAWGVFPPLQGLAFGCFGSFILYWNGEIVPISNRKAGELLALLLARGGGPVHKITAAQTLWPGSDESHAMDNLYKICGALRRVIRQGVPIPLNIQRDILTLDTREMDSDVRRFEALYQQRGNIACCQEAVALYKGPFLFEEYYEWTAQIEAYYDLRYLELLHIIVRHLSETGDPGASYYQMLLNQGQ